MGMRFGWRAANAGRFGQAMMVGNGSVSAGNIPNRVLPGLYGGILTIVVLTLRLERGQAGSPSDPEVAERRCHGRWSLDRFGQGRGARGKCLPCFGKRVPALRARSVVPQEMALLGPGGEAIIVRYADDIVVGFQHKRDAERYLGDVRES